MIQICGESVVLPQLSFATALQEKKRFTDIWKSGNIVSFHKKISFYKLTS